MISIEDFRRIELKVATIVAVQDHPDADRLYVLRVSLGTEERQLVAGIKKHYTPEQLMGKQVIVVNNLEPAMLRGVESQGMLLAASDGESVRILQPDQTLAAGSGVR